MLCSIKNAKSLLVIGSTFIGPRNLQSDGRGKRKVIEEDDEVAIIDEDDDDDEEEYIGDDWVVVKDDLDDDDDLFDVQLRDA